MKRLLFLTGVIFLLAIETSLAVENVPTIRELLVLADSLGIDRGVTESVSYKSVNNQIIGVTIQGKKGYYPSHIARDFTNANCASLLEVNNLSEMDASSLPNDYKLFIPWEMLRDEFKNPLPKLLQAKNEISTLRKQLKAALEKIYELEKKVTELKELFSQKKSEVEIVKEVEPQQTTVNNFNQVESKIDTLINELNNKINLKDNFLQVIIIILTTVVILHFITQTIFGLRKKTA